MPTKIRSLHIVPPAAATAATPSTSTVPADRESGARALVSLFQFEERAMPELLDYFARSRSGAPAQAEDADIAAVLASIPPHHRGALSLHHNGREWPDAVEEALDRYTSLGIRLYCVDHPTVGPTSVAENAAAEHVAAAVAVRDTDRSASRMLDDLWTRADHLYSKAIRAYAKAARRRARAGG